MHVLAPVSMCVRMCTYVHAYTRMYKDLHMHVGIFPLLINAKPNVGARFPVARFLSLSHTHTPFSLS
jgi:hypothetical protein